MRKQTVDDLFFKVQQDFIKEQIKLYLNALGIIQLDTFLRGVNRGEKLTYKYSINIDKKTCDIYTTPYNEEIIIDHNLIKNFKGNDNFIFYGTTEKEPVYIKYNGKLIKMVLPIVKKGLQ